MDVAKIEISSPKDFFISSAPFAQSGSKEFQQFVKMHKIDTIVNISDFPTTENIINMYKKLGISTTIYYPLDDAVITDPSRIKKVLESIYVKLGRRNLVHCTMGINRSALVIAYSLSKCTNYTNKQIIEFIKYYNGKYRKQPALINPSFVEFIEGL